MGKLLTPSFAPAALSLEGSQLVNNDYLEQIREVVTFFVTEIDTLSSYYIKIIIIIGRTHFDVLTLAFSAALP